MPPTDVSRTAAERPTRFRSPRCPARGRRRLQALIPGCRVPFGHLGDVSIHYNVTQPVGAYTKAYLGRWYEMNDAVHAVVAKFGGSISAEHGIGVMKRKLLPLVKDPVALDPNGIRRCA
jgi:FAD/FMN-containing dehydrogenase